MICGAEARANDHFCSNCGFQLARVPRKTARPLISRPKDFTAAGIFTLVLGALIGFFGFLIGIVPIMALGLGSLVLAVMILFLPESMSVKAGRMATVSSLPALMDIEALIVDLDASSHGIYIPAAGFGTVPKVLVPLRDSALAALATFPRPRLSRSRRVFVTLGTGLYERGILLYAPGAEIVQALESCLQLDLGTVKLDDLAGRIGFGLEMLGISKREVLLRVEESTVKFELNLLQLVDLEERLRSEAPRLVEQIGSPLTSAVAAAVAKVTGKFVRVLSSTLFGSSLAGSLEILEDISR